MTGGEGTINRVKRTVFSVVIAAMILVAVPAGLAAGEDTVEITDKNLKQALLDLGADTGADGQISQDEMAALEGSIDLSSGSISELTGLEYATSLESIDLSDNTVRDLGPLIGLGLTSLDVTLNYLDITDGSDDMADIAMLQGAGCTVSYDPQKVIPVLDVTLDESVDMCPGDTFALTATVLPEDAADQGVNWESSNTGVAQVSGGTVTAQALGSALITVTTQDGGYTAQCQIKVVPDEITSSKYAIYNDKLWFAYENTSAAELISEIYNDPAYLSVHNSEGGEYTGDAVGTGMTLRLTVGGQTRHEVTILTRGDANGDGSVSILDYTLVRLHILGVQYLVGEYALAADLNLNSTLTITDYTVIRLHILDLMQITESYTPVDPGDSVDPTNPNDPGYLNTISNPRIRHFIEIALAQQGDPYVSGAEGPNAYDCSGLVYYCLVTSGYTSVYRATATTYSDFFRIADGPYDWDWIEDLDAVNSDPDKNWRWPWTFVSAEDLQPGDLMFYEKDTDDISAYEAKPIGHVGIYLGNGYHIHASSTYGQVIVSRFEGWYAEWFRYGRRINW